MAWPSSCRPSSRTLASAIHRPACSSALPFVFGAIGMVLLGRHSDRTMELSKGHVAVALLMATFGIGIVGTGFQSPVVVNGVCFALRRSASPRCRRCSGRCRASLLTCAFGCRRDRRDQLARKPLRFRRSLRDGLSEGPDRQLYRGPSVAGGLLFAGAIVVMLLRIDVRREQMSAEVAMAH